ncbi:alkaline phosphatase family protein, partial [Thiolapillus sp.]|uniref:alkaline phosphatase family protein n=1 Tax=Thiolapillus sp. TaxID=2017437 RepID=UPI003AF44061
MKRKEVLKLALMIALLFSAFVTSAKERPRLVLQITVDALRGDLPERFRNVTGEGGFRYLMNKGIHYTNANYQHANTETIVGHASLATGAVPAAHGMVGNVKRVFGLVIDFGTSQSPKSTRPLTTYWCPSRPSHQALRNNFASSLLLRT